MRKLLFLSVLFLLPLAMEGKDIKTSVISNGTESETYEDSIVSMSFSVSYGRMFIIAEIKNKTDERIYVEWENAKIKNEKVIFADDAPITMTREKPDESIPRGSKIKKEISSMRYYVSRTSGLVPIVYKKEIKKRGAQLVDIIIPIKYKDKSIDIPLTLKFVFE